MEVQPPHESMVVSRLRHCLRLAGISGAYKVAGRPITHLVASQDELVAVTRVADRADGLSLWAHRAGDCSLAGVEDGGR
jgi:hypothetical protein